MKLSSQIVSALAASCAFGVTMPQRAGAVTDEQFNELRDLVLKQGQKLDQLEKIHTQDQQIHDQDQKALQQDQQKIEELQRQLGQTQTLATSAAQKADAASQVQPIRPIAGGLSATHNFTLAGDAEVQFARPEHDHSGFQLADFAPIFLYRGGDNVLFEAGFDFILQNNAPGSTGYTTTVNLSFATLDYLLNDYVTVVGGNMILPLGTYNERGAGWLNKIPDAPMARGILQGNGVGMQLRGAVPIGDSGDMLTYSVYGVNGPGSTQTNTIAYQSMIDLTSGNVSYPNTHSNPSGGGRIGWFHSWKAHTDLELGVSGQSGEWDNEGHLIWSAAVLDAALHISPYFEVKGEYINTWQETADLGTIHPHGWWVQAGYKLAGLNLDLPYINDLELIGRFDNLNDGQGVKTDRVTGGFVYYLSNTLLFEGDYEFVRGRGGPAAATPGLLIQLSYGF